MRYKSLIIIFLIVVLFGNHAPKDKVVPEEYATLSVSPGAGVLSVRSAQKVVFEFIIVKELPVGSTFRIRSPASFSRPVYVGKNSERNNLFVKWSKKGISRTDTEVSIRGYADVPRGLKQGRTNREIQIVISGEKAVPGDALRIIHRVRTAKYVSHRSGENYERYEAALLVPEKPILEYETPLWNIRPEEPVELILTAPSRTVIGKPFSINIVQRDRFENPTPVASSFKLELVEGQANIPEEISFIPSEIGAKRVREIIATAPGILKIRASTLEGLEAISNPIEVAKEIPSYNIYWGDLHSHGTLSYDARNWSGITNMRPEDMYAYAREVSNLDFCAVTDHLTARNRTMMTERDWNETQKASRECSLLNKFVPFTAVEHAHKARHTNVVFLRNDDPYWCSDGPISIKECWEFFKNSPIITIPHLHPGRDHFDKIDPEKERLVEIYSYWGRFEYYDNTPHRPKNSMKNPKTATVQKILNRGHRLGFVAGSDDHRGRPGSLGLTAVFSTKLTREDIFEALHSRRTYATTGTRIILELLLSGKMMGESFCVSKDSPLMQSREMHVKVFGTKPLKSVEIVRNGESIHEVAPNSDRLSFVFTDKQALGETFINKDSYFPAVTHYYVRVMQEDDQMAWSSPVWLFPEAKEEREKLILVISEYRDDLLGSDEAKSLKAARELERFMRVKEDKEWNKKIIPHLIEALEGKGKGSLGAAETIAKIKKEEIEEYLPKILDLFIQKEKGRVPYGAVYALGLMGDKVDIIRPKAEPLLMKMLIADNEDVETRMRAAWALTNIIGPENKALIRAFIQIMEKDKEKRMRLFAVKNLEKMPLLNEKILRKVEMYKKELEK